MPRLSLPGRNERCHCGSGRKYKQCCQPLDQDIPFPEVNFLPTLLAQLPRKRWPELAGSRVDLERVEDTVRQWLEAGEDRAVVDLLEPWFARDSAFVGKNEFLFDGLLDAYSELRHPRKKASLIDRAARVGDRSIRSAAMQRQVSILADQGKFEQAWALFDQAQKSEPDSPGLSHLEVTTLIAEGREAEARQRADFWARRLARRHGSEFSPLIEFMKDIAKHGAAALGGRLAEEAGAGNLAAALSN
ncbi:MAG: SEC-C domain-containing protein, partial [Wenzhouxiangella sp.]|nr:SEC-C domain-containing protein [Wenzhouxiangella sp.]